VATPFSRRTDSTRSASCAPARRRPRRLAPSERGIERRLTAASTRQYGVSGSPKEVGDDDITIADAGELPPPARRLQVPVWAIGGMPAAYIIGMPLAVSERRGLTRASLSFPAERSCSRSHSPGLRAGDVRSPPQPAGALAVPRSRRLSTSAPFSGGEAVGTESPRPAGSPQPPCGAAAAEIGYLRGAGLVGWSWRRAAPAWMHMTLIECETMSCISRAIRLRSSATAWWTNPVSRQEAPSSLSPAARRATPRCAGTRSSTRAGPTRMIRSRRAQSLTTRAAPWVAGHSTRITGRAECARAARANRASAVRIGAAFGASTSARAR
jgi:hypothetical protein